MAHLKEVGGRQDQCKFPLILTQMFFQFRGGVNKQGSHCWQTGEPVQ
jgi:hypothetical protein